MEIQIYSKPACVQCTATYRALDKQGLDYTVIDITAETGAQA
ncbi:MAG TPA: NrdH-redoxin, partial [Halomonas sp.]|nr:NrdH-redoxin [Halomonas sp.]